MMKTIALVCTNQMIKKIFSLVGKKISISISYFNSYNEIQDNFDVIILDDSIYNDTLDLYKFKYSVLLTNNKLQAQSINKIIIKPFLPSDLQKNLENILNILDEKDTTYLSTEAHENKQNILKNIEEDELSFDTRMQEVFNTNNHKYSKHIPEKPSPKNNTPYPFNQTEKKNDLTTQKYDFDENSTIKKDTIGQGGVLNLDTIHTIHNEIDAINHIIETTYNSLDNEESQEKLKSVNINENNEEDTQWLDIGNAIDKTIEQVMGNSNQENETVNFELTEDTLQEFHPVLQRIDSNVINTLKRGKELHLLLRYNNNETEK